MTGELKEYYKSGKCKEPEIIINDLLNVSRKEICEYIESIEQKPVTKHNIPQYSSYTNGTVELLRYLRMSGDYGPTFLEVGEHFLDNRHKQNAYIKYGENHSKLAEELGIVEIRKIGKKRVFLTSVGRTIEKLDDVQKEDCIAKMAGMIPIVQEAIKLKITDAKELEALLKKYLSPVTCVRRRRNTWILIEKLRG